MLKIVLEDLMKQKAILCGELERAAAINSRSDYFDCWNILDEIREIELRINTLREIIASTLPDLVANRN